MGLEHPLVAVAVAVETDGAAGLDVFAQHVDDGMEHGAVLCACQLLLKLRNAGVDTLLEVGEGLSHGTVQRYHRTGTVGFRTYGTELEAVAREGEGRGAVTVGIVDEDFWNLRDVHLHALLTCHRKDITDIGSLNMV